MTEPRTPEPSPRETLRDLIAEKLHAYECGCDLRADQRSPRDDFAAVADAVMDLFPEVGVEDWLIGTLPTSSGEVEVREQIRRPHMPVTHQRYVLRTAPTELADSSPQPVEETPR